MALGACTVTFAPWRFSYPEALPRGALASVGTLLFFIPGWPASTNAFGFCDKIPFLRDYRVGGGIAFTVASAVLGYALILAATADMSPEYVQILHANGEDAM